MSINLSRTGPRDRASTVSTPSCDEFEIPAQNNSVINADEPDAWFGPAPGVVQKLAEHLPFAIRTSPPADTSAMRRAIAVARAVDEASILPAAGSSSLMCAALSCRVVSASNGAARLRRNSNPSMTRVLVVDPVNRDYWDTLETLGGARLDRLKLRHGRNHDADLEELAARLVLGYDWVVLANPNTSTGRLIARNVLGQKIFEGPKTTRWWIDESDIDFADESQSLESYAAATSNVLVWKSMSRAYALAGLGAAYLCGCPSLIGELERLGPQLVVSVMAQIGACEALNATDYYRARWAETHILRRELGEGLRGLGFKLVPACANVLLCRLPAKLPDAPVVVGELARQGMLISDAAALGINSDARMVRIAVKDRDTNLAMLEILRARLSEQFQPKFSLSSPLHHDL